MSSMSVVVTIVNCKASSADCITVSWIYQGSEAEAVVVAAHGGQTSHGNPVPLHGDKGTVCNLQPNTEYEVYLADPQGDRISNVCQARTS